MADVVFVDCEASSLNSGSFITELGWAVVGIDGRRIHTGACLIKPLPKWLRTSNGWDPASEKLTEISKDMLEREGVSPTEAVKRFIADIGDAELFSDEPAFDQFWLEQLFEAADMDLAGRRLGDAKKLLAETASKHRDPKGALAEAERLACAQIATRHRAEPDARRMAIIYCGLVDHAR